jgi:hypothetical protein
LAITLLQIKNIIQYKEVSVQLVSGFSAKGHLYTATYNEGNIVVDNYEMRNEKGELKHKGTKFFITP